MRVAFSLRVFSKVIYVLGFRVFIARAALALVSRLSSRNSHLGRTALSPLLTQKFPEEDERGLE